MTTALLSFVLPAGEVLARATFVGARLDVRELQADGTVALAPLTIRTGNGYAIVFRYGAVVTLNLTQEDEASFLRSLTPFVEDAFETPETEVVSIGLGTAHGERIDADGTLRLRELSLERLRVVAHILAKSVVLAHYEDRAEVAFDQMERLAQELNRGSTRNASGRDLLRQIGNVLTAQIQTVGRVEVSEKPEITWDYPELDRLYERLSIEYELRDRDRALTRKLDFIAQTAETYLDLLQTRQALRVEWYIVLLIVFEIGLSLYLEFVRS